MTGKLIKITIAVLIVAIISVTALAVAMHQKRPQGELGGPSYNFDNAEFVWEGEGNFRDKARISFNAICNRLADRTVPAPGIETNVEKVIVKGVEKKTRTFTEEKPYGKTVSNTVPYAVLNCAFVIDGKVIEEKAVSVNASLDPLYEFGTNVKSLIYADVALIVALACVTVLACVRRRRDA